VRATAKVGRPSASPHSGRISAGVLPSRADTRSPAPASGTKRRAAVAAAAGSGAPANSVPVADASLSVHAEVKTRAAASVGQEKQNGTSSEGAVQEL